ncbi:MAG: 4-(cytidine 5'-diphospho)-2-C-methyl-D-erythritol kinase [Clostridia bacterium]|nr:4-(cytidine 5'-diphospho)-2-C-methyl-D-erythritol kinase [Clostridia bacterium]
MIRLEANAKINLFLEITGRLENGYHTISTVMQEIGLCDYVSVTETDSGSITLTSDCDTMPLDERNIAYKCAALFFEKAGMENKGINIHIEKNIPMEAGLAGGSTDGGAVLKGLNEIYGYPFNTEELCAIGAKIGADIPFCILGGTVLCEGIGDIMTPISPLPPCHILIAKGKEGVSTKWAYEQFDLMENREVRDNPMPELLKLGDIHTVCKGMYNCFELLVPSVEEIKNIMNENGALGSMMSGSGTAVFGIFDSEEKMKAAGNKLQQKNISVFCCDNR